MRKKKSLFAFVLTLMLACSLLAVSFVSVAASTAPVGVPNTDWVCNVEGGVTEYVEGEGTTMKSGSAWGARDYYKPKLQLNGLEMEYTVSGIAADEKVGFGFNAQAGGYYDSSAMTLTIQRGRPGHPWLGVDDLDIAIAKTHAGDEVLPGNILRVTYNPEKPLKISFKIGESTLGAIGDQENPDEEIWTFDVEITNQAESVVAIKSPAWQTGADGVASSQFFVKKTLANETANGDSVRNFLNESTERYMFYGSMNSTVGGALTTVTKLKDSFGTELIAAAEMKVASYESVATENASVVIAAKSEVMTILDTVRFADRFLFNERIASRDAAIKEIPSVISDIKALSETQIVAYETAANTLEMESAITTENITLAKQAKKDINPINLVYLSESDISAFNDRVVAASYKVSKAEIIKEVIAMETLVTVLEGDITANNVLLSEAKIVSVKKIKIDGLTGDDQIAINARITAAETKTAELKNTISDEFADFYMTEYEAFLTENADKLMEKATILTATAKKDLVVFDETHPNYEALNARFIAANATLNIGITAYYNAAFDMASAIMEDNTKNIILSEYSKARKVSVEDGALSLLDSSAEGYAALQAKASTLATALNASKFKDFTQLTNKDEVTPSVATIKDNGIEYSAEGRWPVSLCSTQALDMMDAKVALTIDPHHFDTDTQGSLNLCFNFLAKPNNYKGTDTQAKGITIMIWLFQNESNVVIYNYDDNRIAGEALVTPDKNGMLAMRIRLMEDYWLVQVNDTEIVFAHTSGGVDKNIYKQEDNSYKGYFSVGSFSNTVTQVSNFNIKQIGDTKYTTEEITFPTDKEPGPGPGPGPNPNPNPTPEDPGCGGCGSAKTTVLLGGLLTLAGLLFITKRKI